MNGEDPSGRSEGGRRREALGRFQPQQFRAKIGTQNQSALPEAVSIVHMALIGKSSKRPSGGSITQDELSRKELGAFT